VFSEASNVKVLVENVWRGRRECGKSEGDILEIFKYISPRTGNVLQGMTELVVLG